MNNIDIEYFDREIRTYDLNSIYKLNNSSVLIYGLEKGLATEISKNLILCGIKELYLYDEQKINNFDIETGYFYSKDNINQIRSTVLTNKLKNINRYSNIYNVDNYEMNQDITILINQPVKLVKKISKYCRTNNMKLIVLWSKGLSGVLFVDAGINHSIYYDTKITQILNINNLGYITCTSNHNLQTGDNIIFTNLEGFNIKILEQEWKITVINKTTLQLDNFNISEEFIFNNGTLSFLKKNSLITHNEFSTLSDNKLINTYLQMFTNNLIDKLPKIWTDEMNQFMNKYNISIPDHAKLFNYELIPIVSLMGSITSSETIKLITNKYTPISQWFSWTDDTLLPKNKPLEYINSETSYGFIYGTDIENKLINSEWLIAGFGSIGCEHLKNMAFMNIKNITIIDFDMIEKSNLNNQFIFNKEHIGKYKAQISSEIIKKLKPDINVKYYLNKLSSDDIEFSDLILSKLTGVLNSCDNINSRKFIDEQCFKYNLPLFDSGVSGNNGSIQPIIPFITETFSASNDIDNTVSYPLCVIKNFPIEINHTIVWALEQFEFFTNAPTIMNKWSLDPLFINKLDEKEKIIAQEYINLFIIKYPIHKNGLISCITWAIDMFNEYYYNTINKLLETFPSEHKTDDGNIFWTCGKKCPKPIKFDHKNIYHLNFIESTVHLLAQCSGISNNFDLQDIINIINSVNNNTNNNFELNYIPQILDYNNDSNWHVKWITSTSNMRALNYSIPISNFFETKGIVGNIIPRVVYTSSIISGLTLLELLKNVLDYKHVELYKSTFINLSESLIINSEPIKASMIDIAGVKMNSWTKFDYTKDTTLNEFKKYYEDIFKTLITMIVIDTTMIYADFLDEIVLDKKISNIILEHFNTLVIPNIVSINLLSSDNIDIPIISIKLS